MTTFKPFFMNLSALGKSNFYSNFFFLVSSHSLTPKAPKPEIPLTRDKKKKKLLFYD